MNRLYVKKRNLHYFYYWLEHIYQNTEINIDCSRETLRLHLDKLSQKEIIKLNKEIEESQLVIKQYDELIVQYNAVKKEILCSPRELYVALAGMKNESFENIRFVVFKKWAAIVMPSEVIYVHK